MTQRTLLSTAALFLATACASNAPVNDPAPAPTFVTTVFVEETGVEVDRPQAAASSRLEKTSILIALTNKGEVVHGGRKIGIDGVAPLVERMLQKEDMPVIIQADTASQSGLLMRIIGEAKLAGATKVSVATTADKG